MRSGVPLDIVFGTLANQHRRRLLMQLCEPNPPEELSAPEDLCVENHQMETLRVELIHTHLPQLEAAGFITWDRDSHVVEKGPRFEEIRPLLDLIADHAHKLEFDWP